MDRYGKITISHMALTLMNNKQFETLQKEVLHEDRWGTIDEVNIYFDPPTVMIQLYTKGQCQMLIGIEKDGYCHS